MREMVRSQLARAASAGHVVVFFAGSDPLNPLVRPLLEWLESHGIEHTAADLDSDESLVCLRQQGLAAEILPILCVDGRVAATGPVLEPLLESGQLQTLVARGQSSNVPVLAVTEKALAVWRAALSEPADVIRLHISAGYEHSLSVDSAAPEDLRLEIDGMPLVMDRDSASRADGIAIDWITSNDTAGFRIDNPSAAPNPRELDCSSLARILAGPQAPLIIDARTEAEYQIERLPASKHLDSDLVDALVVLDRRTRLLFYCDNGRRSRRAALHYVEQGFADVAVLSGGINAWKIHLAKSGAIG
jgi:monothiol glutaredoxin